jgi:hypothetical protein
VRLDHLLSKEHWPHSSWVWSRAAPRTGRSVILDGPRVSGVVLEGGTLTSSAAGFCRPVVRRHLGGVWNQVGWSTGVVGTLLGPEGTGDRCTSDRAFLFLIPSCLLWECVGSVGSGGGFLVVR